jgi:hypothetical protein
MLDKAGKLGDIPVSEAGSFGVRGFRIRSLVAR